jgi:hypothetical protein
MDRRNRRKKAAKTALEPVNVIASLLKVIVAGRPDP